MVSSFLFVAFAKGSYLRSRTLMIFRKLSGATSIVIKNDET